jgi:hypothetical protein
MFVLYFYPGNDPAFGQQPERGFSMSCSSGAILLP